MNVFDASVVRTDDQTTFEARQRSRLASEAMIAFNAGTHQECVHMLTEDFRKLTQPKVVSLARLMIAGFGW